MNDQSNYFIPNDCTVMMDTRNFLFYFHLVFLSKSLPLNYSTQQVHYQRYFPQTRRKLSWQSEFYGKIELTLIACWRVGLRDTRLAYLHWLFFPIQPVLIRKTALKKSKHSIYTARTPVLHLLTQTHNNQC